LPKVNNNPIVENSPNLVTLALKHFLNSMRWWVKSCFYHCLDKKLHT
jgi:hypothetical protein